MTMASNTNLWVVAGLVYALAGSALLCNAAFLSPAPTRSETGSEAHVWRRLSKQWLDMRIGAAVLMVGFFLQATGTLGTETLNKPAIFILLGLAFATALYAMTKDLVVEDLITAQASSTPDVATTPERKETPPVEMLVATDELTKVVDLRSGAGLG